MRGGIAKTGGGSHVAGMRAMPRLTQYRFKYISCCVSWDQQTYLGGIGPKASYILTLFSANNEVLNLGLSPHWGQAPQKVPKKSQFCSQVPNFIVVAFCQAKSDILGQ